MKVVMVTREMRLSLNWALSTKRKAIPRCYPASISNTVLGSGYQEEDDAGVTRCRDAAQGSQKSCPTLCLALSKGFHCREGRGGHGGLLPERQQLTQVRKENVMTKQRLRYGDD